MSHVFNIASLLDEAKAGSRSFVVKLSSTLSRTTTYYFYSVVESGLRQFLGLASDSGRLSRSSSQSSCDNQLRIMCSQQWWWCNVVKTVIAAHTDDKEIENLTRQAQGNDSLICFQNMRLLQSTGLCLFRNLPLLSKVTYLKLIFVVIQAAANR